MRPEPVVSVVVGVSVVVVAGGSVVVPPNKVGDMGIYAQVKDTEGNIIGLWESLHRAAS